MSRNCSFCANAEIGSNATSRKENVRILIMETLGSVIANSLSNYQVVGSCLPRKGTNSVVQCLASLRPVLRAGRPQDSRQDAGATNLAFFPQPVHSRQPRPSWDGL